MKDFEVIIIEKDEQVPTEFHAELKPIKIYVLPEGSIENQTSYCVEMVDNIGRKFAAQITHKMFIDAWENK